MAELIVAQPPAQYAARPPLVVDASVLAAALFGEENQALALSWMRGHALAAPQLVDYEIANIAVIKQRRGIIGAEAAAESLALYASLDIARLPAAMDGVLAIAMRCELTAYDASYLWLAAQLKAPLATFDNRLGKAAQSYLGSLGSTS